MTDEQNWREADYGEFPKDGEYTVSAKCTNGCGSVESLIFVKCGVRKETLRRITCTNCGCEAKP